MVLIRDTILFRGIDKIVGQNLFYPVLKRSLSQLRTEGGMMWNKPFQNRPTTTERLRN